MSSAVGKLYLGVFNLASGLGWAFVASLVARAYLDGTRTSPFSSFILNYLSIFASD